MSTTPLHEILGCSRSATPKEVRKAYYAKARLLHPDKCPQDATVEERAEANSRYLELQKAYNMLTEQAEHAAATGNHGGDDDLLTFYEKEGSEETIAEAKAKLAEAEEYDMMLSRDADRAWREEDRDVVETSWRNAHRVIEEFRGDLIRAEVAAKYKRALEKNIREERCVPAQPAQTAPQPVDGPRTMSDNIMGVGAAFSEIYEDVQEVYQGYFDAWNSARQWMSGK